MLRSNGYPVVTRYNGITNDVVQPCTNSQGCVLMVYGLDKKKINCEKIFNLFCLYGNVCKVSFVTLLGFFFENLFLNNEKMILVI